MNVTQEKVNGTLSLMLDGDLTIATVKKAYDDLTAAGVEKGGPVEISLAKVTDIDTSGIQLLCYLGGDRAENNVTLCDCSAAIAAKVNAFKFNIETLLGIKE